MQTGPLDGVYAEADGRLQFHPVAPPGAAELEVLFGRITWRIARHLERRGLLVRDLENSYLTVAPGGDAALDTLLGHSITYRIAVGPNEGRKAFTLQSLAPGPLNRPPGRGHRAAGAERPRPGALHPEDSLPRRHHARRLRAAGLHRPARRHHPGGAGQRNHGSDQDSSSRTRR